LIEPNFVRVDNLKGANLKMVDIKMTKICVVSFVLSGIWAKMIITNNTLVQTDQNKDCEFLLPKIYFPVKILSFISFIFHGS
jgi:hypothetical protein